MLDMGSDHGSTLMQSLLMHSLRINSFRVSSHKNAYIKYLVERDIYEPRDVFAQSCVPS